ncbi:uncharacterized protein [Drosophila kikkawai]|uniref:Uncharacterized protein n=1 Tax=Drosophila kikkawai TaxID=30033 RepID=A0ABM4GFR5_DROKI
MSAAKRLRERSNTELKAPDATSTQMLQLINARFDEQKDILSKELRESEARVLRNLQEKFQAMAAEISNLTQRVTQLENEVKKVDELQQRVQELGSQLSAKDSASGLVEGENHKLCFSLNLTPPPPVRTIFRTRPRRSGQTFVDPVIIIKFEHVLAKAELLRAIGAYRRNNKKQLSLQLIGFESPALIYLNEQLTKPNYDIFKEAMRCKKHNQLTGVFTRRGVVYVKLSDGGEPRYVQSSHELSELINDAGGADKSTFRD